MDQPSLAEPPLPIDGAAKHWDHRADDDYYSQPGALFRLMPADEQQRLFDNTARSIAAAGAEVRQRHIDNCTRADPAYGAGIAAAIEAQTKL
jgi:catalase